MTCRSISMNADTGEKTWLTPPNILAALGHFDTDPCCPPSMPWRTADTMLTEAENGVTALWTGRVWLNPPYGREAIPFLRRMAGHRQGGGSPLSLPAPTRRHGRTGYSLMPSASCFCADASASAVPTERLARSLPRHPRSSRIPSRTLYASVKAGLQGL